MRQIRININQAALAHNLQQVKNRCPNSRVLAMVKANAYGHGVTACLPALTQADALGVACMAEAVQLRNLGWQKGICLIEGVFSQAEWLQAKQLNLMCVIHHQAQLHWAVTDSYTEQPVWIKVNTGMNRLGFTPEQTIQAAKQLKQANYQLVLTMHYANADVANHPINQHQQQIFAAVRQQTAPQACSVCNSAALLQWQDQHYDWVRPGIMLYGSSPIADKTASAFNLQPVMQFSAAIIAIHHLKVGDCVGYGSGWQASQSCTIATVSCGYGDGYPRVVKNSQVNVNGIICPIVGRVSMDMLTIDVSHVDANIGDTVILWGNTPTIDDIATCNQTVSYELLCRLSNRPQRTSQSTHST